MDVLKGKVARELAALEEELDEFLERTIGGGLRPASRVDRLRPPTDVCETEEGIVVQMELAGVRAEDLRLIVDGEYLQITGTREPPPPGSGGRYLQMEIPRGRFERVLRVGVPYDPDQVSASVESGILTVVLPRKVRVLRKVPVSGS
ncbi:MAG: Hsp20/alpha crystallin family protein [Myxococcota bacterium]